MTTENHTPLPWAVFEGMSTTAVTHNGKEIIKWTGFDEPNIPRETHFANARLIVTAVNAHAELVGALKKTIWPLNYFLQNLPRLYDFTEAQYLTTEEGKRLKSALDEARALLAKLEAENP